MSFCQLKTLCHKQNYDKIPEYNKNPTRLEIKILALFRALKETCYFKCYSSKLLNT